MTSGTVSSLFFLLLCVSPSLAQTQQAQFNQVLNLNGDMQLNSFAFPDGSKIETFSQKQQQLIVNQQTPAVPANQVTGSTGSPFVALMQQSMTISTNGATNLVGGQIELAMNPQMLQAAGITPDNAFVAMLSPDRQTWMIQETVKTVNGTDNTVRMIKRVTMDGEYMALGRQTAVTGQALTPFGSDPTTQVNIVGSGLQENEFQDGFRTSVRAANPLTMNVNVKKGIDTSMLSALQGQTSVNDYRYSVVTSLNAVQPNLNQMVTVVQMPINALRIQEMMQAMGIQGNGQVSLAVAQRTVLQNPGGATGQLAAPPPPPQRRGRDVFRNVVRQTGQTAQGQAAQGQTAQGQTPQAQTPQGQTPQQAQTPQQGTPTNPQPVAQTLLLSPTFTPVQAQAVLDPVNMRIAIPVRQIDGEFILTMARAGEAQAAAPQPQQPQGQTPQGQTPAPQEPQGGNSTRLEGARPSGEPTPAGEPKPTESKAAESKPAERRQEKAPTGAILMTMDEINKMVELQKWGGQAPISQMMNDYVKSQSGK